MNVTELLVGFEERFDAHGHDTRIVYLQPDETGTSVLACDKCGASVHVVTINHGGWYQPSSDILDRECVGQ